MCVQRILTLWGRAYLLELEWKCQSLSYFSPPPFSGVLVKHVMSAGGSIGCVCACGGSHVPSPACARPCDAGPVSHPPRPPNYCCAGTHGYTWGTAWMLVLKSAGSQETARFSNTHIFAKKYISIKKQDIIFKINRKKKSDSCWVLLHLSVQFVICTNVQFQHFLSAPSHFMLFADCAAPAPWLRVYQNE